MPLMFCLSLIAAAPQPIHLPVSAKALAEPSRYESVLPFDKVIDYFQKTYGPTVRWHPIVNLPTVRASHMRSLRSNTMWEGVNIYEYKGKVRIYVLERQTAAARHASR